MEDELFETDNDQIRDWFVNLIFTGKTIAEINKMPKAELDRLDGEFKTLEKLINSHLRSILDEVIGEDGVITGEMRPQGYPTYDLTESYRNELRKEQRQRAAKYLSGKETK